jgi:hypothetical protein
MAEEPRRISLDMARHRVAEAKARLLRQREIVLERVTEGELETAAMGTRVLRTMEANLAVMREHLRMEEQRGSPPPVEEASPKAAPPQAR